MMDESLLLDEESDGPDDSEIVICRDVPGAHVGGRECWCNPGVFYWWDEAGMDKWMAEQEQAN